jgi:hypothetical protein
MRRLLPVLALLAAHVAAAQMPPSISKPIEQAHKAANATDAQTAAMQQVAKPAPVAAAQKAAPRQATSPAERQVESPAAKPAAKTTSPGAKAGAQDSSKVTFDREVFAYVSAGRRDPFASPIETGEIRPLLADLKVVGIMFDPSGRNSVVVMRDMSTQQQYRAKTGQVLGRAKVTQIKPQEVVMTIDEYGFSRQEILPLNVKQAQQTKGKP